MKNATKELNKPNKKKTSQFIFGMQRRTSSTINITIIILRLLAYTTAKSACSSCIMYTLMLHQQHAHRHGPLLAGGIFEHSLKNRSPTVDKSEVGPTKRIP